MTWAADQVNRFRSPSFVTRTSALPSGHDQEDDAAGNRHDAQHRRQGDCFSCLRRSL